jgi:hypothetical protein
MQKESFAPIQLEAHRGLLSSRFDGKSHQKDVP